MVMDEPSSETKAQYVYLSWRPCPHRHTCTDFPVSLLTKIAVNRFQNLCPLALSPLDFLDDQPPRLIESRHPGLQVESAHGAYSLSTERFHTSGLPNLRIDGCRIIQTLFRAAIIWPLSHWERCLTKPLVHAAKCMVRRRWPCKLQWLYILERSPRTTPKRPNEPGFNRLGRRAPGWPSIS